VGKVDELADELLGLGGPCGSVGLRLGPPGARHEEEIRVGPDRLLVAGGGLHSEDAAADSVPGPGGLDRFNGGRAGLALPCGSNSPFQREEPRPSGTAQDGPDALTVNPAGDADHALIGVEGGEVGVDLAAEAVGHPGHDAVPAGSGGCDHEGGLRGATERFGGGGIGRVAGRTKVRTAHAKEAGRPASGDRVGGRLDVFTGEADGEFRAQRLRKRSGLCERFEALPPEGGLTGFRVSEAEESFHDRWWSNRFGRFGAGENGVPARRKPPQAGPSRELA